MADAHDVDYWRQLDTFDPAKFKTPVAVIGAGATGSYVALLLAKMGVRDLTVWDHDIVEPHNLPNQIFGLEDVGRKKVDALADFLKRNAGVEIGAIPKKFEGGKLKGVVFVLVDTMECRKAIWKSSVEYKLGVELMVETRMGVSSGMVFAVKPASPAHVDEYAKTLYADAEAAPSPCTNTAIAPTVALVAGCAASVLLEHANGRAFPNDTLVSVSPFMMRTKQWR